MGGASPGFPFLRNKNSLKSPFQYRAFQRILPYKRWGVLKVFSVVEIQLDLYCNNFALAAVGLIVEEARMCV